MTVHAGPEVQPLTAESPTRPDRHRIGALLSLGIVAIWAVAALALQLTTPGGMDRTEMLLILTLTPLYLVLLPLYWRGVRWGYPVGVLALLALPAGAVKQILDRVYVFSWSPYNVAVVVALLAAVAGIYLSIRSFRERPPVGITRAVLTAGALVALVAGVGIVMSENAETIRRVTAQFTLDRIDARLERLGTIDDRIAYLAGVGRYPSLSAGIVVGDSLVWSGAYGDAEPGTVYEIGSVTKPFVATAILRLDQEGLLDLDDDVNAYLPFEVRHPQYPDQPITIRMLLSHQSGLGHLTDRYHGYHYGAERLAWLDDRHGEQYPTPTPRPGFPEFLAGYLAPGGEYHTPEAWTSFAPGAGYSYSSPGYDLAAYLVERVSGLPFDEYLHTRLLEPLQMDSSGLSVHEFPDRQAVSHWRLFGVLSQTNDPLPLSDFTTAGGGGMVSTVSDLARFMGTQLNGGIVDDAALLPPETVEMMQARIVSHPKGAGDLNQVGYGLGLGRLDDDPWQYWGHSYDMHGATGHGGSTGGSTVQMWFVDEEEGGYGMVLATNVDRAKDDYFDVWFFSTLYRMQTLLMDEARTRYEASGR